MCLHNIFHQKLIISTKIKLDVPASPIVLANCIRMEFRAQRAIRAIILIESLEAVAKEGPAKFILKNQFPPKNVLK